MQLITDNTDSQTIPESISSIIKFICGENKINLTFDEALISLREYANKYNNGQIPKYMECIRQVGAKNILNSLTSTLKQDKERHIVEGSMAFEKSLYLMQSQGVDNKSLMKLNGVNKNVKESHVSTYNDYQQQHLTNQNTNVNNNPINAFRRV